MIVGIIYQRHERIILGNKAGIEEGFFFKMQTKLEVFFGADNKSKKACAIWSCYSI